MLGAVPSKGIGFWIWQTGTTRSSGHCQVWALCWRSTQDGEGSGDGLFGRVDKLPGAELWWQGEGVREVEEELLVRGELIKGS